MFWCGSRRLPAKVESSSATFTSFSLLPLGGHRPAWQPPAHAAAPPPVCQIAGAAVHPAVLPVLCSSRPSADGRAVSEDEQHDDKRERSDNLDDWQVQIGENWDGRTSQRSIHFWWFSFVVQGRKRTRTQRPLTRSSSPSTQDGASGGTMA